ncbi:MAG: hypothetical protein IPM53_14795 [Anaerolineaceae bacterium]|nr:hypothetical protein [Anaerolineaceae bacterium]
MRRNGQIGCLLAELVVEALLDYVFKIDFRQVRGVVVDYIVLFFAGSGGMLGVAANAGRGWTVTAVILFLTMTTLVFVQRIITGL